MCGERWAGKMGCVRGGRMAVEEDGGERGRRRRGRERCRGGKGVGAAWRLFKVPDCPDMFLMVPCLRYKPAGLGRSSTGICMYYICMANACGKGNADQTMVCMNDIPVWSVYFFMVCLLLVAGGLGSRLDRLAGILKVCHFVKELIVLVLCYDMARTVENSSYFYTQLGSLKVTGEIGIGLEVDYILNEYLSFGMSPQVTVLAEDLTFDMGCLSYYELTLGIYSSLKYSVNPDVG